MPAVLFELAFISAASHFPDVGALRYRRDDMAMALAEGIYRYLGVTQTVPQPQPPAPPREHWAEPHFEYLREVGVTIHERRFDDPITRGEVFALLAQYDKNR